MIELKKVETKSEIALVSKLAFQIFPVDYLSYVPEEILMNFLKTYQSVEAIEHQLNTGFNYYLILAANEIAGYVGLSYQGSVAFLSKFYLCLDKRNQGLGQKVLSIVENLVREKGCTIMELLVLVGNTRAIKFYHTNGFAIDTNFVEIYDDINTEKHFKMIKPIQ
jgi:ribosomal protein S18 acetylase RimI-like enzyme